MNPTVRLRHTNKDNPCSKQDLAGLAYGTLNVPFTRIFTTNEGYKVICRNEEDADKILNKEATREFERLGLTVMVPIEMKTKRSIFIKKLDNIIGEHTAEEIKAEIEKENKWIKITEVTKIKNYTTIMKLRLEDIKMVVKAKQQGILAFNLSISPDQIEQEDYIQITTCYRCYELDDHQTNECPHTNLTICSECGERGHTFKNCTNEEKRCINCEKHNLPANHRTLAMACPIRKNKIKEKSEENKKLAEKKKQETYAEIAKRAAEQVKTPGPTTHINLSDHKHTKILISIMHAHIMNLANPGSYQKELNAMLQKNELPTMWFPENPDSSSLLGATFKHNETTEENTEKQTQEVTTPDNRTTQQPNRDPRLEGRNKQKENETGTKQKTRSSSKHRTEKEQTTDQFSTPTGGRYPEEADEIGLKIYLTGKNIMPTQNPHNEFIKQQIHQGNFKWTYTETRYNEDDIRQLIVMNKIKITKFDFKRVDEGTYRKIRNGLMNRSPPEEPRRAKK